MAGVPAGTPENCPLVPRWFHVGSAGSVAPLDRHQEGDEKNPWNTCQMATEEQPDQWSFQEPIYWRYLPYIRPI